MGNLEPAGKPPVGPGSTPSPVPQKPSPHTGREGPNPGIPTPGKPSAHHFYTIQQQQQLQQK